MAELADFLKIPKIDSCNDLLSGMRYSSYTRWAGFEIPDFPEDDECYDAKILDEFKFYSDIKINGRKDLQSLFFMSVSEAAADNVKTLFGGIDLSLCKKCESPADFVSAIQEVKEKSQNSVEIKPVLAINSDTENNLFLAGTFVENKSFDGILLTGGKFFAQDSNLESYDKIFTLARKNGLKTEISCAQIKNPDEMNFALATLKPDFVKDISKEICDEKTLDFIKQTEISADFTPFFQSCEPEEKQKKFEFMRQLFDSGTKIHLGSGNLLLLKKSLSEFAVDLCDSGFFSIDEAKNLMSSSNADFM